MRKRINNLFFVIGITSVIIMLCTFDVSFTELWAHIRRANYWLAGIFHKHHLPHTRVVLDIRRLAADEGREP